ncbi:UNVERIFIED_CONTAM: hypothetical protein Slati_0754700 [Sesamum latifolium]|uniref:Uncharacterized protein n=1 Tax=Sesamum latifolium TaxID=2727402 RepID=A0AAW2XQR2_9LAMI
MEITSPRRFTSGRRPYLPPPSGMAILLVLIFCIIFSAAPTAVHAAITAAPAKSDAFTPPDNFLLDCGIAASTTLPGIAFSLVIKRVASICHTKAAISKSPSGRSMPTSNSRRRCINRPKSSKATPRTPFTWPDPDGIGSGSTSPRFRTTRGISKPLNSR